MIKLFFIQVKLGLSLPVDSSIAEFRELLWSYTGIYQEHMLITEITDIGFNRTFCGNYSLLISINIYFVQ